MAAAASSIMVPSKPHFFKPLLPGFHHGLLIPISFLKYLKVKNPDRAVLRTSCGEWEVKVGAGGRRFEDGWADFAKRHDLQVGDFLVFRHEGDMVFDVIVFDPSACERESYPRFDVSEMDSSEEQEQSSESVSEMDSSEEQEQSSESVSSSTDFSG